MLGDQGAAAPGTLGAAGGEAFLAEHIKLGGRRAVKRIRRSHPFYRQLAGEAQMLGRLRHPAIPLLYEVEEDEGYLYLIEEYVEGISLKDIVLSGRLKEHQIIHITIQICDIIQYLHEQEPPVYYLDLKPENLLLEGDRVRLVDFGSAICAVQGEENPLYLSSEGFAAPELCGGGKALPQSDLYGIGSVLAFMLGGAVSHRRWGRQTTREALGRLAGKCLQASPRRRGTVAGLRRSLAGLEGPDGRKHKKLRTVSQGKQVIGVLGTHPGAGTTFISLMLACYLADRSAGQVVYVEYNRHGDCARMLRAGRQGRVACLPGVRAGELIRCLNDGYDYYVIDFGWELEECREEYLRCTRKLVVTQLIDWKLEYLEQFRTKVEGIFRQDSWHYLFNLSTEKAQRRTGIPGSCIPWETAPEKPSPQAEKVLESLLFGTE